MGLLEISNMLGFAPQHLFFLVRKSDDLYRPIKVQKRADPTKNRILNIPITELKGVQRAILEKILSNEKVSQNAFAYVKQKSLVDLAKKLCGRKAVYKLDIEDFFPSITFRRVFGLFVSIGHSSEEAFILSRLTTCKGQLAQGAPTSPYISNLIFRNADKQLKAAAASWALDYGRYSDDLYFWCGQNFHYKKFSELARVILISNGFRLNNSKSKYFPRGYPRKTLGLMTHNNNPTIPKKARRAMRAAFHKGSRSITWAHENLSYLSGLAEWHKCVYGKDDVYQSYKLILKNVRSLYMHEPYGYQD